MKTQLKMEPPVNIELIITNNAGRYSIGIVLYTRNQSIPGFPNTGFISGHNTNTLRKVAEEEEEEEKEKREDLCPEGKPARPRDY